MKSIIQPRQVKSRLIRLGNPNDGGYAIEEGTLQRVDALYSYGVGHNVTFEIDFWHRTRKPVFIFDHTVEDPKIDNLMFKKEGLAPYPRFSPSDNFNNFLSCNSHDNVLLKMDIEGAEVEWIKATDFETLPVDTLIIEFHNLPYDLPLIQKINQYYKIVWIHANNAGHMMGVYPKILEVTFVRSELGIFGGYAKRKYPLEIDSPNLVYRQDLEIDLRPLFV